MSNSQGVALIDYTAHRDPRDYHLLARAVRVNEDGKLTFGVRELYCGNPDLDQEVEFIKYSANSAHDEEEIHLDFEEANKAISVNERPWLLSLEDKGPYDLEGTGKWYVTALAGAKKGIWKKEGSCYVLDHGRLCTWLRKKRCEAEVFDDEENWDCVSECSSDDDEEGEVDDEGEGGSDETVETDVGYDGDASAGSACEEGSDVEGTASVASG
jgi:hypothetical protein